MYIYGFKNNRRDIGILNLEINSLDELVTPQVQLANSHVDYTQSCKDEDEMSYQ